MGRIPDFKKDHTDRLNRLTEGDVDGFFCKAEKWDSSKAVKDGGAVIFPHSTVGVCGAMTAAAVNAVLDSGADKVLVIGCLHALTDEMNKARARVAEGGDPADEEFWGIQGPGLKGRTEWENEFSLLNFQYLWDCALRQRGIKAPELVMRYPFLAGGRPDLMPGIKELGMLVSEGCAVVATMDPFHHGIGYGDPPERSLPPENGGLDLARQAVRQGLDILESGDYYAYNRHCVEFKSDGRDVGQVLRHLVGKCRAKILDLAADDMTDMYGGVPPTWVAGALILVSVC